MPTLIDRLLEDKSLPSPPGIALEIIRLNQEDEVSIVELAETVSRDPAIAAKLMRTANSPGMGRPGQVADIEDAVMVLGTRSVNLLALSFSLTASSSGSNESFDYTRFWTSSAVTTTAARLLAERYARAQRDEAFLAGLLADFGQLMLAEAAPDEYQPVIERQNASGEPLQVVEHQLLDCNHAQLGESLLSEWGLPPVICEAIGAHHAPQKLDGAGGKALVLARILHMASSCASLYVTGAMQGADEIVALGQAYFDMSAAECQTLLDEIVERVPESLEILDLNMIDPAQLTQIRNRANELLVTESLALNKRVQEISKTLERLSHQYRDLEIRATIDSLTGLHNRAHLIEVLEREIKVAAQTRGSLGLLFIDVDEFKQINDSHGHLAGDTVLKAIANLIKSHLSEGQLATRVGGDEFIVLCPDVSLNSLLEKAQQIRRAVDDATTSWSCIQLPATVSVGGCVIERVVTPGPAEALIDHADSELYRAKEKGRNRVFVTAFQNEWS